MKDMEQITGRKAIVTKARKSISNFKLRQGMPIGCKVTLRGEVMYEFLDRLISIVIPRLRDFHGIPADSFDGRGNYSFGLKEQTVFPEIEYDKVDAIRGLNIAIVTTRIATTSASSSRAWHAIQAQRVRSIMAKKSLILKQQRTPKFKVRKYNRCMILRKTPRLHA